jgi:hypothetical protein
METPSLTGRRTPRLARFPKGEPSHLPPRSKVQRMSTHEQRTGSDLLADAKRLREKFFPQTKPQPVVIPAEFTPAPVYVEPYRESIRDLSPKRRACLERARKKYWAKLRADPEAYKEFCRVAALKKRWRYRTDVKYRAKVLAETTARNKVRHARIMADPEKYAAYLARQRENQRRRYRDDPEFRQRRVEENRARRAAKRTLA